jgi:hypothetical protein
VPSARSAKLAPDCRALNIYAIDRSLQDLLAIYLPANLNAHMVPQLERLRRCSPTV